MIPRYVLMVCSMVILGLALSACGEEPVTPVSPPPKKISQKTKPQEPSTQSEDKVEEEAPAYEYSPVGKRDPFQSFTEVRKSDLQRQEILTPLQKFEIDQLRLIAVIIGKGESRAMVVAPDGKSYILKKGIKVGKNNGTVVDIEPEAIHVEERYFDFSGEVRTQIREIALPVRVGDE